VPPAHGEALTGLLPRAELSIVAEAGHYPQIEQLDRVVDAIGGFVGRQDSPRTTP
jgi:pimeloyl-ACP methyl ester carboxylesterase